MKTVFWELDSNQAEYILNVLATRPYNEVGKLLDELLAQTKPAASPQTQMDLNETPARTKQ